MTPTKQIKGLKDALRPDSNLGLAILVAEDQDGHNEPVSVVSTIREAEEAATEDLRRRMRGMESGTEEAFCPSMYKLWARGIDGVYQLAHEIDA